MTREKAAALLPIIQAFAEGKAIEIRIKLDGRWEDCPSPAFNSDPEYYRIKPEPREWTLAVWKGGPGYQKGFISEHRTRDQIFDSNWLPVRVREILD